MAELMRSDHAVRNIEKGLAALLAPFNRTISEVISHYNINRHSTEILVRVMMPWGDEMRAGVEIPHTAIVETNAVQIILHAIYELGKVILDEQDIKEEVAEGSLPPEALDALAGIENVPHTLEL